LALFWSFHSISGTLVSLVSILVLIVSPSEINQRIVEPGRINIPAVILFKPPAAL
jgi:hypothetical protein